ncbi:hypothetical protein DKX38_014829 [Salix brachista]|uniref:Reverse transcriptase zinc-binding domain-containing protein n=1 Tax=Salix brachista TaxID=2182728 RepID=A0A5N5LGA4_9ROSI|nr:hypothetical protein DKX38_014829 [Salix brachista]
MTISFIYGSNIPSARQEVWDYVRRYYGEFQARSWILMGDFNATMKVTDSAGGDKHWSRSKEEFGQCLNQAELHSVPYKGIKYTWHNGQEMDNMILKKLDWVIGNVTFAEKWTEAFAQFLPRSASDHSSMLLHLNQGQFQPRPRFRFLISHITRRVAEAKNSWDRAQEKLDRNPMSVAFQLAEKKLAKDYQILCKDEESFYKQFFHKTVMHRKLRNRIISLTDDEGNEILGKKEMGELAAEHFKGLLNGRTMALSGINWNAAVASIIRGGDWHFSNMPPEISQVLNNITFKPKIHENDSIVWKGHASGKFSVDSAWNLVRKKKPLNPLHGLIWYTGNVPRYAMNLWLASLGRLSTMDRPHMAKVADTNQCSLCGVALESHSHLFFQCSYSARVWKTITGHTTMYWPNLHWEHLLNWAAIQFSKRKGFTSILMRHSVAIAVYFIWTERNCRVFQGDQKPASVLAHEAIMQLRLLLMNYKGAIPEAFRGLNLGSLLWGCDLQAQLVFRWPSGLWASLGQEGSSRAGAAVVGRGLEASSRAAS